MLQEYLRGADQMNFMYPRCDLCNVFTMHIFYNMLEIVDYLSNSSIAEIVE